VHLVLKFSLKIDEREKKERKKKENMYISSILVILVFEEHTLLYQRG